MYTGNHRFLPVKINNNVSVHLWRNGRRRENGFFTKPKIRWIVHCSKVILWHFLLRICIYSRTRSAQYIVKFFRNCVCWISKYLLLKKEKKSQGDVCSIIRAFLFNKRTENGCVGFEKEIFPARHRNDRFPLAKTFHNFRVFKILNVKITTIEIRQSNV